ncbi:MAG TPA: sugar phosphate isomerase/epimerase family protein [Candidatus Dormibacteraeota bacterium]|nr:sugar phosphate isomerase/epimerase family protein [Candidatus Dormibacteraeota bacterium]
MQRWLSLWSLGPDFGPDDLRRVAEIGFRGVEVWGEHARAREHLQWAWQAGLQISLHLPFHDLNPVTPDDAVRDRMREVCRQWLVDLSAVGGRHAVIHGGYAWTSEERDLAVLRSHARLRELGSWARALGIAVLLENLVPDSLQYTHPIASDLTEWLAILDAVELGACLDTGHLAISGPGYPDALEALGARLQSIHLSDNDRKSDRHLWPGDGLRTTDGFIEALSAAGYDGPIVYEINPYVYERGEILDRAQREFSVAAEES